MSKVLNISTVVFALTFLVSSVAVAQTTFTIDFQGPTVSLLTPDSFFGVPISEGDILTTAPTVPILPGLYPPAPGLLPPPGIVIFAGGLGVAPGPAGISEVDAMSYGRDILPDASNDPDMFALLFSVDEFAIG